MASQWRSLRTITKLQSSGGFVIARLTNRNFKPIRILKARLSKLKPNSHLHSLQPAKIDRSFSHGLHWNNLIYYKRTIASPGKSPFIFFIMQVKIITAIVHQYICNTIIYYRKFKFVRLYSTGSFWTKPGLNQLTFIGFKNISFFHHIVQFPGFYSFAKYKIIFPPKHKEECYDKNDPNPFQDLFNSTFFCWLILHDVRFRSVITIRLRKYIFPDSNRYKQKAGAFNTSISYWKWNLWSK